MSALPVTTEVVCNRPKCEVCAHTRRREARAKMTKAQLRQDAAAADEAYMNASEWSSMTTAYNRALERHLRHAHGCDHDFGDVAETA